MSGIRGDFKKLGDLVKKLDGLCKPAFRQELSRKVAEAAIALVKEEFSTGTDPNGKAWPPPVLRRGSKIIPLNASGNLKNSFHVPDKSASRFVIETNVIYASVHQYGKTITAKNWRTVTYKRGGKTITSRRFGLVFRGVTTTTRDYVGKDGTKRRSTRRSYDWYTCLSVKIPRRQIIPENTLPPRWVAAFKTEANKVLNQHLK